MTALQLIHSVAIRNGWSVVNTWVSRNEYYYVVTYGRERYGLERIEVRYNRPPSSGVHSTFYTINSVEVAYVGPRRTGRRAAAINWLKR